MAENRPNILLIITDQQRGDCLGIDGHPVVQTPYIDEVAAEGYHFPRAYTTCPVCIPARRTLMTGKKPASHGVTMNYHTWLDGPTLPGELSAAGYQTHLVGKLHLWPLRKLYGFDSAEWSDSPSPHGGEDDYSRWLQAQGIDLPDAGVSHGMNVNGAPVRSWNLPEQYHFTNWVATEAINFLDTRDPTVPFFLKMSFHQPHQPHCPPQFYYDRYMNMDLPEPAVGEWARKWAEPQKGLPVAAWRYWPSEQVMKQFRAAYYGCINHIDDQVGRVLNRTPRDTVVLFVSDHGEMLGDHQWIRKRSAYEPSARIPFAIRFPQSMGLEQGQVRPELVSLEDVMPTLLDAAGVEAPEGMDGRSLLAMLRGESDWREHLHGECADVPTVGSGQQYITDDRWKYIWYPGTAQEQLFDLQNDPQELHDLAGDGDYADELARLRGILIEEIKDRPEGFVQHGELVQLEGSTPFCLPGYEQGDWK